MNWFVVCLIPFSRNSSLASALNCYSCDELPLDVNCTTSVTCEPNEGSCENEISNNR